MPIKLGGVPTGVATPPIDDAYAVNNISPKPNFFISTLVISSNLFIREIAIGNIIAVVAVLLNHHDKKNIINEKTNVKRKADFLTHLMDNILIAIILSIEVNSIAFANIKLPRNKNIIGCAKLITASFSLQTPNKIHNTGISNDVTAKGNASDTQYMTTNIIIENK